jgi:hypothetical protein
LADKTRLTGKSGSRALAHNPEFFAAVRFAPSKVVVVVNFLDDFSAKDFRYTLADPIATGVGVRTSQIHALDVLRSEIGRSGNYAWRNVHAVLRAAFFQKPRCELVT